MKTVVINTAKDDQKVRLDILFKVPFGADKLLWINTSPDKLERVPEKVRRELIDNALYIDKEYRIVFLVDLLDFDNCSFYEYSYIYKVLLYINKY